MKCGGAHRGIKKNALWSACSIMVGRCVEGLKMQHFEQPHKSLRLLSKCAKFEHCLQSKNQGTAICPVLRSTVRKSFGELSLQISTHMQCFFMMREAARCFWRLIQLSPMNSRISVRHYTAHDFNRLRFTVVKTETREKQAPTCETDQTRAHVYERLYT